jgi:hypothetical protein
MGPSPFKAAGVILEQWQDVRQDHAVYDLLKKLMIIIRHDYLSRDE